MCIVQTYSFPYTHAHIQAILLAFTNTTHTQTPIIEKYWFIKKAVGIFRIRFFDKSFPFVAMTLPEIYKNCIPLLEV